MPVSEPADERLDDGLPDDRLLDDGLLAVDGCLNFRDVGGWELADGRRLRPGRLYRADDPTRLTDAGWARVAALGLSCVVDLRQQVQFDRGVWFAEGERLHHVPLVDRVIDLAAPPPLETPTDMADLYEGMLARSVEPMAHALDLVADHLAAGPVLVHCVYGKDRTGLLVAAIMAALGFDGGTIAAEYARSDGPTQRRFQVMATNPIPSDGPVRKAPPYLFTAPADAMRILLDRLVTTHGSLRAWSASLPVRPTTFPHLASHLLTP